VRISRKWCKIERLFPLNVNRNLHVFYRIKWSSVTLDDLLKVISAISVDRHSLQTYCIYVAFLTILHVQRSTIMSILPGTMFYYIGSTSRSSGVTLSKKICTGTTWFDKEHASSYWRLIENIAVSRWYLGSTHRLKCSYGRRHPKSDKAAYSCFGGLRRRTMAATQYFCTSQS